MQNIKRMLLIGVLATASIIGSGCKKSNTSTVSTETAESTIKESKVEVTTKKQEKKDNFKNGRTLGTIGAIDLETDSTFPKSGFIKTNNLFLGFDENKGELASCFFKQLCTDKFSAEETWNVEYSENIEKLPNILKGLTSIWNGLLEDRRMYFIYSAQKYEVVVDNTERVTYNGVDFIKEEGHIDVTRKDPDNTNYPELVRAGYIAYYYFSPEGAGAYPADDNQGYGMGMAIWGVRPVDMSNTEEAKTMEENYEKLKKSTTASMETLISLDDYWKLDK
jgi:lipoprotein